MSKPCCRHKQGFDSGVRKIRVTQTKIKRVERNDEKSKTTARLTKRDIFETIFRLARPAFFRFRC